MCSLQNIFPPKTTSFHSQFNGPVKGFHCSLKISLQARLAGPDWFDHLPLVMLDLPPKEFLDRVESALLGLTLPPPHHVDPFWAWVPKALDSAEFVFVHEDASIQPLSQLYRGPYRVLSCKNKFISLEIGSRTDTVSVDCLKPVIGPVLGPQQPP